MLVIILCLLSQKELNSLTDAGTSDDNRNDHTHILLFVVKVIPLQAYEAQRVLGG
jgi:hypothetical protein